MRYRIPSSFMTAFVTWLTEVAKSETIYHSRQPLRRQYRGRRVGVRDRQANLQGLPTCSFASVAWRCLSSSFWPSSSLASMTSQKWVAKWRTEQAMACDKSTMSLPSTWTPIVRCHLARAAQVLWLGNDPMSSWLLWLPAIDVTTTRGIHSLRQLYATPGTVPSCWGYDEGVLLASRNWDQNH